MTQLLEVTTWSAEQQTQYLSLGYWHKLSLSAELTNWCKQYTDNIAIIAGNRQLTYQALEQQIELLAAGFYQLDVKPKDRSAHRLRFF